MINKNTMIMVINPV